MRQAPLSGSMLTFLLSNLPKHSAKAKNSSWRTPHESQSESRQSTRCCCTEVLEHVADDSAVAEECYRILREGGVFVLSSPNASFPIRSKKSSHTEAGPELHVRPGYSPFQLKDLLRQAGFTHIQLAFALPLIGTLLVEALERLYTISRGAAQESSGVAAGVSRPHVRVIQTLLSTIPSSSPASHSQGIMEEVPSFQGPTNLRPMQFH